MRCFTAWLLLAVWIPPASAAVYKCTDAGGHIAYQQRPCSDGTSAEEVTIRRGPAGSTAVRPAPEPPALMGPESSDADASVASEPVAATVRPLPNDAAESIPHSWRCDAENGETWFQHSRCPASIVVTKVAMVNGRSIAFDGVELVHELAISRDLACKEIHRPSAGSRRGSARDEQVSPYDKLKGLDPC